MGDYADRELPDDTAGAALSGGSRSEGGRRCAPTAEPSTSRRLLVKSPTGWRLVQNDHSRQLVDRWTETLEFLHNRRGVGTSTTRRRLRLPPNTDREAHRITGEREPPELTSSNELVR